MIFDRKGLLREFFFFIQVFYSKIQGIIIIKKRKKAVVIGTVETEFFYTREC